MKRIKLLLTLLVLTAVTSLRADPYFVVPHDTPDHTPGDFLSWETAATNIQDAVTEAGSSGATVWVSNGTYRLSAQITIGNLKLRSWPDGLTNRDTTIVDGNQIDRCFDINHADALVEGFTITGGYLSGDVANDRYRRGAGVRLQAGTLRNCLVTGNTNAHTGASFGGGIYAVGANSLVENCDIIGNQITVGRGGGVSLETSATLRNCRIIGNSTLANNGGGIIFWASGNVYNSIIASNTVPSNRNGGGIHMFAPVTAATIRNSLLAGNRAGEGAGIYLGINLDGDNRGATIENSTIVNNENLLARQGGGTYFSGRVDQTVNVRNTIVYGNSGSLPGRDMYSTGRDGDGEIFTTACDHVLTEHTDGVTFVGDGNITDQSPVFVDAEAGNYRLRGSSPCIDAGTNQLWMVDATDLAGNARIGNQVVDIGAYEYIARGIMIMFK